jgi:MoaA/NifB/PqqE/SkfB family radical SAM enzyme
MPFSQSSQLSAIVGWLEMMRPKSLLDVGAGMGIYGLLARTFIDGEQIFTPDKHTVRYRPASECPTQIEGIEGFLAYNNPIHDFAYANVRYSEALDSLSQMPDNSFEVILAIDILEHFPKEHGVQLLSELKRVATRAALISTPKLFVAQHYEQNALEDHRSVWGESELAQAGFDQLIPNAASWIVVSEQEFGSVFPLVSLLREGVSAHLRGDVHRAETLYHQVLLFGTADGDMAAQAGMHGSYLLSLLMLQTGRHEEAKYYVGQALEKGGVISRDTWPAPATSGWNRGGSVSALSPESSPPLGTMGRAPEQVFLELTTECNLRCSYCALSLPDYVGEDMDADLIEKVVAYLLARGIPVASINVHGETTRLDHWQEIAKTLHAAGMKLHIISNFSRSFSRDEVVTLSHFSGIRVSVDSFDRVRLRHLRSGTDPRIVLENLLRIRTQAALENRPSPQVGLNCVITDTSLETLKALVATAAQLGIKDLMLHNAAALDGLDKRPRVIADMSPDDRAGAADEIRAAMAFAEQQGVRCQLDPSLKSFIDDASSDGPATAFAMTDYFIGGVRAQILTNIPKPTETRDCLDPWSVMKFGVNGKVYCCCIGNEVMGDLRSETPDAIWQGTPYKTRRQQMLSGDLPKECRLCPARAVVSRDALFVKVQKIASCMPPDAI